MPHPRPDYEPTLGRIVLYRSPNPSAGLAPAIIVACGGDAHQAGAVGVPLLSGRCHLVVFTPAGAGTYTAPDVGEDDHANGEYVEDEQTNGTWRWPMLR